MSLENVKSKYYRMRELLKKEMTISNLIERRIQKEGIKSFKNIHCGNRCFIIGNGPSLKPSDLDLLKDEICFASNRIFYIYEKTDWRPTYYCAQDKDVIENILTNIEEISNDSKACFFASYCKKMMKGKIKIPENSYYYYARLVAAHKERKFSSNIAKYVDGGGTITYAAMQLAAYMGIKEIYLLGVDHSYSAASFSNGTMDSKDVKGSYFEGMPSNIVLTKPNTDSTTISFEEAKKYADAHDIKIYNATRGGKLEIFQRVSLDTVINNEK